MQLQSANPKIIKSWLKSSFNYLEIFSILLGFIMSHIPYLHISLKKHGEI